MLYAKHFSPRVTPQSEAASPLQVQNSAGGYTFKLDDFAQLERFLILGAEGGTYYASEKELSRENAKCVQRCLAADGARTVATIASISESGRAPKNDAAIFALALAASDPNLKTRSAALAALPRVCRIGTHLFQFVQQVKTMRGFGVGLRKGIAAWYANLSPEKLAYQITKYQQRGGMSHRDVLRLTHPEAPSAAHDAIYRYIVAGIEGGTEREVAGKGSRKLRAYPAVGELPDYIHAFETLKSCSAEKDAARLISQYRFPHECVPSELKKSPLVWEALLPHMPLGALTRNLATLTRVGLLEPLSAREKLVAARFSADAIAKARLHPIAILSALRTYAQGHGERGSNTWKPNARIVDALDAAFYDSFGALQPGGARTLLAFDISGSMDGGTIAGVPGLTPRVASAAMGMVTARSEASWHAIAFTSGAPGEMVISYNGSQDTRHRFYGGSGACGITELTISPRQRLDDICRTMSALPLGGTDCAAPMLYALGRKLEVDTFCVYTDNETWAGPIHPHQALQQYRDKMGIDAKLVVVGMTATGFSIANPEDAGMLDVVGFDTAAPQLIADFSRPAAKLQAAAEAAE